MNVLIISGNISKVGELRHTAQGKAVMDFSIACNMGYGENQHTEFYKVVLWDNKATGLQPHLQVGDRIIVKGEHRIDKREHEGKTYVDNLINWPEVDLCSAGGQNKGAGGPNVGQNSQGFHKPPQTSQPQHGQQPAPVNDFDCKACGGVGCPSCDIPF